MFFFRLQIYGAIAAIFCHSASYVFLFLNQQNSFLIIAVKAIVAFIIDADQNLKSKIFHVLTEVLLMGFIANRFVIYGYMTIYPMPKYPICNIAQFISFDFFVN